MADTLIYGDISPRTAAHAVVKLLERALPYLCIEKFGQTYVLPSNSTKTAKFRRYFLVGATGSAGSGSGNFYTPLSTTPLVEGVTPAGSKMNNQDYSVTIAQYGNYITISDVIRDTHEDPILTQAVEILGEEAAQVIETLRFNVLKAGTNVTRVGAAGATVANRTDVNGPITLNIQRSITTSLNRQQGRKFTNVVKSTPDYRTEPLEASYIGLVHPDLDTDIRNLPGFIPVKQYGSASGWENEIGSVEQVRYLASTVFAAWESAGAATSGATTYRSTDTTNWDVYPILYLARDAYGLVPLKGKESITPMVVNPKPAAGDPLAQRGTVGWKAYSATVILQEAFMVRAEVTATS